MPEISAEERRRRRQEKIKASAANRLAKITEGNRGRVGEKSVLDAQNQPVSSESSTLKSNQTDSGLSTLGPTEFDTHTTSKDSSLPSSEQLSSSAQNISQEKSSASIESPLNNNTNPSNAISNKFLNLEDNASSSGFEDDPLFKLLSQLNSASSNNEQSTEDINAFASQFASMMGMPAAGTDNNDQASSSSPPPNADVASKYRKADVFWRVIHTVIFTFLAISAGLGFSQRNRFGTDETVLVDGIEDKSLYSDDAILSGQSQTFILSRFLWYFSTAELILQSSRFFIEKGAPPADSIISTIANYIPHPFNEYFYIGARYLKMAQVILQDFCIVLFVFGICSYFSK